MEKGFLCGVRKGGKKGRGQIFSGIQSKGYGLTIVCDIVSPQLAEFMGRRQ